MVENAETIISEEQPAEEEYTTLGTVLTAARQARGLSIEQISSELRIESRFLTALEEDDLELFAAPVFVKGYIRHLAHRYELEYEDLLARYTRQTDVGDAPVTFNEPIRTSSAYYVPWLVGGLILVLGIPAIWFTWGSGNPFSSLIPSGQEEPGPPAEIETAPFNAEESPEPGATAATAALPGAAEILNPAVDPLDPVVESLDPLAEPAEDAPSVPVDATAGGTPAPDAAVAPTGQIVMNFEEDCWTEITDGDGNALHYAIGNAGTTLDIDGAFPLSFLLGNPSGVQLSINDQPYPIPAPPDNESTVRFVVPEAP